LEENKMNTKRTKTEAVEIIELKHENQKEIIGLQNQTEDKRHKNKLEFVKIVYDFKNAFVDKEDRNKLNRLLKLYELKAKEAKGFKK